MPRLQVNALTPAVIRPVQYTVCSHGYVEMIHKEGSERAIWASGGLGGCWLISTNQWVVPRDPWDWREDPRDPGQFNNPGSKLWLQCLERKLLLFFPDIRLKECGNRIGDNALVPMTGWCMGKWTNTARKMETRESQETQSTDDTGTPAPSWAPAWSVTWVNVLAFC